MLFLEAGQGYKLRKKYFVYMVFDDLARGAFETHIDNVIKDIPQLISRFRQKEIKNILQFRNEDDFLYGVIYGRIIFGFVHPTARSITHEDIFEMQKVLVRRLRDVKDAIVSTG
jgi:hypothetical protein